MSFPRIFRLLRSLGLRHVIVVDNSNQVENAPYGNIFAVNIR